MRNLKTKGFTLVELIVVIAIIGVLAAVLVPAMLGYMRDSKISQANQNAHAVYTAAQAAVTKYCTANGTRNTKGSVFTAAFSKGGAVSQDVTGTAGSGGTEQPVLTDFGDYLGDQFSGDFSFTVGSSGDTVEFAVWSQDTSTLTVPYSEDDQVAAYKAGTLVGVHPQYPVASSGGASSGT